MSSTALLLVTAPANTGTAETTAPATVSLYDARPFFEKALAYGVQHKLISQGALEAMRTDAPKGMVQIARYVGNEFLRPELEKSRERLVNLVSLHLEHVTAGNLQQAAQLLETHSFLSRSKAGSDLLKALIAMPTSSHFGMHGHSGFTDNDIPALAKWTLRSLADYQAELQVRAQVAQVIGAAVWMADELGMDIDDLAEAGKDAEAVIRTALLVMATKHTKLPDWVAFEKMVLALRKKYASGGQTPPVHPPAALPVAMSLALPTKLPAQYKAAVETVRQSLWADWAKICDPAIKPRKLFDQTPAFMGRYFWVEDALSEVDHYERTASAVWSKATGGHMDDSSLLTLFFCIAAQAPGKTMLTEKTAMTLLRKIRKTGFQPALANDYIGQHAPELDQADYVKMWADFVADALAVLQSDFDHTLQDALALLKRDCNIA